MTENKKRNNFSRIYEMATIRIRRLDRRRGERSTLAYNRRNLQLLRGRQYVVYRQGFPRVNQLRQITLGRRRRILARGNIVNFLSNIIQTRRQQYGEILQDRNKSIHEIYEQLRKITSFEDNDYFIRDNRGNVVVRFNPSMRNLMVSVFIGVPSTTTIFDNYRDRNNYNGSFYISRIPYTPPEELPNEVFGGQQFADNETTDCVIVPIEEKIQEKIDKIIDRHTELKEMKRTKTDKQKEEMRRLSNRLSQHNGKLKICEKYREISKRDNGLDVKQIQELANEVRFSIHLYIPYLNLDEVWVGNKGSDDRIDLYNTRFNHLDKFGKVYLMKKNGRNNEIKYTSFDSQEELQEKFNELKEGHLIQLYFKNNDGISSFCVNQDEKYHLKGMGDLFQKFKNRLTKHTWYIESGDLDNESWANNMTGVCGCIDFMSVRHYRKMKEEGEFLSNQLDSVDRKNSYFNYDLCGNYHKGLAGKYLYGGSLPNPDTIEYKQHLKHYRRLGKSTNFYLTYCIYDIEITNEKLKYYNDKLKVFTSNKIFSDELLTFLDKYDTKYKVRQYKIFSKFYDLFSEEEFFEDNKPIKDVNGIPLYSKYVGKLMIYNKNFIINICGDKEYCSVINNTLSQHKSETTAKYNEFDNDIKITTPLKTHTTLTQISGSITQKQILCVLEQLMEMEETKVVRVVGDGIYTIPHEYKVLSSFGFRMKNEEEEFKLGNFGGECFTSQLEHNWENFFLPSADMCFTGITQHIIPNRQKRYKEYIVKENEMDEYMELVKSQYVPRKYYSVMIVNGMGGSGKTFWCMRELLKQNNIKEHEVLFLSPTHNLANEVRIEYFEDGRKGGGDICFTRHKITGEMCTDNKEKFDYLKQNEQLRKGRRVMIVDEFTQMSNDVLHRFIQDYWKTFQIILVGDIGFRQTNCGIHPFNYQVGCDLQNFSQYIFEDRSNIVQFDEDYRAKDERLKELKNMIRKAITIYETNNPNRTWIQKREEHKQPIKRILSQFPEIQRININDIRDHFVINEERTDVIVSGYNDIKSSNKYMRKRYLDRLKGGQYSRYRMNDTTIYKTQLTTLPKPKNSYETYCMSCNSIQGTTVKEPSRVFVDLEYEKCMFSLQHFFVAISRVNYMNQLCIINK